MGYAAGLFRQAPDCAARTIDVSGDGESNDGFPPQSAYRHFALDGVTVNALAIGEAASIGGLVDYFRRHVIRGPGAFVESAMGFESFETAMRRKLERETANFAVGWLEISR